MAVAQHGSTVMYQPSCEHRAASDAKRDRHGAVLPPVDAEQGDYQDARNVIALMHAYDGAAQRPQEQWRSSRRAAEPGTQRASWGINSS